MVSFLNDATLIIDDTTDDYSGWWVSTFMELDVVRFIIQLR